MAARNPPQPPGTVPPWPSPNAASALPIPRAPLARTATAARARVRDRRALERRVAPPRRAARPFACPASPCSAPRSCHPGLVQTLVGPTQCGCAKHTCCHFARVAACPCPYAWHAGTASAGRPARRMPARAQLSAGSLSRCSPWDRGRIARKSSSLKKNRQTHRPTNGQIDRRTNRHTHIQTDEQNEQTDHGPTDRPTDGQIDKPTDDGQTDR